MRNGWNYKTKEQPIDDPQKTLDYWLKLVPIIWKTKTSKEIALKRFILLKNKNQYVCSKLIDSKIKALKILLKK